jgi:hypothetical protein
LVIRNRGSKSADQIKVSAYFSEGIEPVQVLGQRHHIEAGKVTLDPIVKLGPGEQVVARIIARASKPGSHIFRAEVQCPSLEAKLSSQKTTRFYGEEPAAQTTPHPAGRQPVSVGDGSLVEPAAGHAPDRVTPSHPKPVDPKPVDPRQAPSFLRPQGGAAAPR